MSISYTLFLQVVIMFLLIFVGFFLKKLNKLSKEWVKESTTVLLYIVTPCVLVNAYQIEYSSSLLNKLLSATLFSILFHIISIVITTVLFKKEDTLKYRISIFGSVYSNCGFMAIPILTAVFGNEGVFYGSAYLAIFTLFYWTHGLFVCSGTVKTLNFKNVVLNPGIIGSFLSIGMFLLKIKLPTVILESVRHIASMNTPLAMIVIGTYLVDIDLKKALKNINLYIVTFLRLLILPIMGILLAILFKINPVVAKTMIISAACPTAAVTSLFATKFDLDEIYATEIVSLTTILSIITIPTIMLLSNYIFK